MGVIQRFKDIMSSNINALLDKAEDPSKMVDQYLRNLESDLGKVKAETAAIMAEEKRAKRELDECNAEIDKMQKYAQKALVAGNEADARQFLEKKAALTNKKTGLDQSYQLAADNAGKMRQMHDKLVSDINTLNAKKDSIKAKMSVAKTREKVNKIGSGMTGAKDSISAFEKMEAKADKMLDQANAMAELNQSKDSQSIDELTNKYDTEKNSDVDDELEALKSKLGLNN